MRYDSLIPIALAVALAGLLWLPRWITRTDNVSRPPAAERTISSKGLETGGGASALDAELVALESQGDEDPVVAIKAWRAFAERAAGTPHAALATLRVSSLESQIEEQASKRLTQALKLLTHRDKSTEERRAGLPMLEAVSERYADYPTGAEARRLLADFTAEFKHSEPLWRLHWSGKHPRATNGGLALAATSGVRKYKNGLALADPARGVMRFRSKPLPSGGKATLGVHLLIRHVSWIRFAPITLLVNGKIVVRGWSASGGGMFTWRFDVDDKVQRGQPVEIEIRLDPHGLCQPQFGAVELTGLNTASR